MSNTSCSSFWPRRHLCIIRLSQLTSTHGGDGLPTNELETNLAYKVADKPAPRGIFQVLYSSKIRIGRPRPPCIALRMPGRAGLRLAPCRSSVTDRGGSMLRLELQPTKRKVSELFWTRLVSSLLPTYNGLSTAKTATSRGDNRSTTSPSGCAGLVSSLDEMHSPVATHVLFSDFGLPTCVWFL
jgi:hypothetical protein